MKNVPVFGTANLRSFQIWVQLGATEGIWYEYGAVGVGDPGGLITGAENRDGTSAATLGMDVVPSTAGYFVNAGSPTPGGSVTIDYNVLGKHARFTKIVGLMTTDITAGTAKIVTTLHVTP